MAVQTKLLNLNSDGSHNYLPSLMFLFSTTYFVFLAIWLYLCHVSKRPFRRIHLLMASLLLVNALNLLFAAEDKHYLNLTGTSYDWDVLFFMFNFIRAVLLLTVIVFVTTRWTFFRLWERGKKVLPLYILVPLQVILNVALVVVHKARPDIKHRVTWNRVFLLLDLLSCCAILFLIVWSIRSFREGKHARNLDKFVLFSIKVVVACNNCEWVGNLVEEIAGFVFYVVLFYLFRLVDKD